MVSSRNLYPSSCSKWFLLTLNDYYFFRNIETHNQAKMSETLGLTYYGYDSIKLEQIFLSTVTILELKGKPRKIWSYKKYSILEFVTSWMSRKILNLCDTKIHRLCGYLSTLQKLYCVINLGNLNSATCQTQSFTQSSKVFTANTAFRTLRSQTRTSLDTSSLRTRFRGVEICCTNSWRRKVINSFTQW